MPRAKKTNGDATWNPDPAELAAVSASFGKTKKIPIEEKSDPATLAKMAESFETDGDLVDIWERRMLNPDAKQSRPIRLKTPGMHLRWINLSSQGRYQRARYDEGWVPVVKAELIDEREIYGVNYTNEGWVCRGERQSEMLMKIPEAVWRKIRSRRYAQIEQSNKQIKANMQSAGAKHFSDKYDTSKGHEIADTLGNFKGDIKFGVEKVEPDPDFFPGG